MNTSVTPASASARSDRYETLDHWRGLACLMVVVYHSAIMYLSQAVHAESHTVAHLVLQATHRFNMGVALFFVISGYCIAAAAEGTRRRGRGVREYFVRRLRRIYPPLWAGIVVGIAVFAICDYWPRPGLLSSLPWGQPRPTWYTPSQWFGNLTLTESWRHYVFGAQRGHFPGQAWTLCYEEQFYLIVGAIIAAWPRHLYAGAAGVTLFTGAAVWAASAYGVSTAGFFFDGSWFLFAAGVGVHCWVTSTTTVIRGAVLTTLLAATVASAAVGGGTDQTWGLAFAVGLVAIHRFDGQLAGIRALRPFAICGQMCYSLYLVHQLPVKAVSAALLGAGVSGAWATLLVVVPLSVSTALALGWAFHLMVERRFLNSPQPSPTARPTVWRDAAHA